MSEVLKPIQDAACELLTKGHKLGAMALLGIVGEVAFYAQRGYNIEYIERLHAQEAGEELPDNQDVRGSTDRISDLGNR